MPLGGEKKDFRELYKYFQAKQIFKMSPMIDVLTLYWLSSQINCLDTLYNASCFL